MQTTSNLHWLILRSILLGIAAALTVSPVLAQTPSDAVKNLRAAVENLQQTNTVLEKVDTVQQSAEAERQNAQNIIDSIKNLPSGDVSTLKFADVLSQFQTNIEALQLASTQDLLEKLRARLKPEGDRSIAAAAKILTDEVLKLGGDTGLIKKVEDALAKLTGMEKQKEASLVSAANAAVKRAELRVKNAEKQTNKLEELVKQITAIVGTDTEPGTFQKAVTDAFTFFGNALDELKKNVTKDTLSLDNKPKLRADLIANLPNWEAIEGATERTQQLIKTLDKTLIETLKANIKEITDKNDAVRKEIKEKVLDKLAGLDKTADWLKAVDDEGEGGEKNFLSRMMVILRAVEGQKPGAALIALDVRGVIEYADSLERISSAWSRFLARLQTSRKDEPEVLTLFSVINDKIAAMRALRALILSGVDLIEEGLAGNMKNFVTEQIRLFYFTNTQELIQILNRRSNLLNNQSLELRQQADNLRHQLNESQGLLFEKQGEAADAVRRVQVIQQEIKQVTAEANDAALQATNADRLLTVLTDKQKSLEADIMATTDAGRKESLEAQKKIVVADIGTQTTFKQNADARKSTADQRRQDLLDEQKGLPAKLTVAQTNLSDLQKEVRRQSRDILLNAQLEAENFGLARDHPPIYVSPARADSTDPAKRVLIYGFVDSNTVYVRGKPDDVESVKEIIAEFDRPAPQARITLWTMQISGANARRLNDTLRETEKGLRTMRANIGRIQDILRNSINKEVNRTAQITQTAFTAAYPLLPALDGRIARALFFAPEVRDRLGFVLPLDNTEAHIALLEAAQDLHDAFQHFDEAALLVEKNLARKYSGNLVGLLIQTVQSLDSAVKSLRYAKQKIGKPDDELCRFVTELLCNTEKLQKAIEFARIELMGALSDKTDTDERAFVKLFESYLRQSKTNRQDGIAQILHNDVQPKNLRMEIETKLSSLMMQCQPDQSGNAARLWGKGRIPDASGVLSSTEAVTVFTLPDPSKGTTLGQMFFILSLAKRSARERVLFNFYEQISELFTNLSDRPYDYFKRETKNQVNELLSEARKAIKSGRSPLAGTLLFPKTLFGAELPGKALTDDEFTSNQEEILLAIESKARASVAEEVQNLTGRIRSARAEQNRLSTEQKAEVEGLIQRVRLQYLPLLGWVQSYSYNAQKVPTRPAMAQERSQVLLPLGGDGGNSVDNKDKKSGSIDLPNSVKTPAEEQQQPVVPTREIVSWFGIGLVTVTTNHDKTVLPNIVSLNDGSDYVAWAIAETQRRRNPLSYATARVAAADDLLKRMVIAAEDDVDRFFVQPTLQALRQQKGGVEFGVIQRESVLATNRLVARVDPKASGSVTLPGEQDLLASAAQLVSLTQTALQQKESIRKANGILRPNDAGALGNEALLKGAIGAVGAQLTQNNQLVSFGTGVLGLLSALSAQPTEQPGEIYSIGTGNTFKVTPIFDPSGQALRFKFDFIASTQVREPNGTTNNELPKVERHTVNTEVQLSNLEVREISRFEANAQIGIREQKTGGLPFLNQIYPFNQIPIVGYYTRRAGQAGIRQESLILGQTAMYPTISDIVDLMVESPSRKNSRRGSFAEKLDEENGGQKPK